MFDNLIDKLVIVEFERTGMGNQRTIARLISVKDGFAEFESPTAKNRWAVALNRIVELNELPASSIKSDRL